MAHLPLALLLLRSLILLMAASATAAAQDLGTMNPKPLPPLEAEMYDRADIYLMGNDVDNMPSSIVECLASGLPVITTDAGGIPYIVTDEQTCLMVARNDHEAMASSALRLLADEELTARLARNAREHCQKFSWPEVQREWLSLYHGLGSAPERARHHAAQGSRRAIRRE